MPIFSERLEQSLQRAHTIAGAGHYEYSTLEHLLLALADDEDAAAVLRACNVDIEKLQRNLVSFIDSELAKFETGRSENAKPSAAFQRVVQRAVVHARSVGREEVTAANVLVAILTEREGQTSAALEEQAMTRYDATLYICHGIAKADQLSRRRIEAGHRPLAEPSVRLSPWVDQILTEFANTHCAAVERRILRVGYTSKRTFQETPPTQRVAPVG